jgi:hypothetical protein
MYFEYNGFTVITKANWLDAGLSENQYKKDSVRGLLKIVLSQRGNQSLIDFNSLLPRRKSIIQSQFGDVNISKKEDRKPVYSVEIDQQARAFYETFKKQDGKTLTDEQIDEYTSKASVLKGVKDGWYRQNQQLARVGSKIKKEKLWKANFEWYKAECSKLSIKYLTNVRSFEREFKAYLNDGYKALLHGCLGNDSARKVSKSTEHLLLALYRKTNHPFVEDVHQEYLDFVYGVKEFYDKKSGECFRPEDFQYKGKPLVLSVGTVWNYLKGVLNNTAIYMDRNGNFDYNTTMRPNHNRKKGAYSLSKISMDDRTLSRKSVRGWVNSYMAVDVVSGYWFRPAYIIGRPNEDTVYECFRNMFCELDELGLPTPAELEVEYFLMKHLDWLNDVFPYVRFCNSPTEKRAEHAIKSLKYGTSKRAGHSRGRWYAKHEAWRVVRNKVDGDFVELEFQPQNIIADDLADIEAHNNELHPLQNTFPGMTRKEVFLKFVNPELTAIAKWKLYRHIGNIQECTIYNNNYVMANNEKFELADFNDLRKLKPNNRSVEAYWLPDIAGSVETVYLYQDEMYIGKATNMALTAYNECAVERTETDEENMLYQMKRAASFDKMIREIRHEIPQVGVIDAVASRNIAEAPMDIVRAQRHSEDVTPNYDYYDYELVEDYAELALAQL